MTKKRPYEISASNGMRISVQASSLDEAYRNARNELIEINKNKTLLKKLEVEGELDLTPHYYTYHGKDIAPILWTHSKASLRLYAKYRLDKKKDNTCVHDATGRRIPLEELIK